MSEYPLLSVIVPVYGTEKYYERCVNSIKNQTYKNIEIIVVDDGSPGNIKELAEDPEVRLISHNENKGLYQARITGVENARGDYIAFVDSDDYVSADYYRTMVFKSLAGDFDIVAGDTVFEQSNGQCFIRNMHKVSFGNKDYFGYDLKKAYFSQRSSCFSWHTVWNKIYKKSLWNKCISYLKTNDKKLVMTEDIAFSSILFYCANSFTYCPNEGYHYCENKNASTDASQTTVNKFNKNVGDIAFVFDFVNNFLKNNKADEDIVQLFSKSKKYYSRMWRKLFQDRFSDEEKKDTEKCMNKLSEGNQEITRQHDYFFDSFLTYYDPTIESIKNVIINEDVKAVSFDLFDTLVWRPLYKPEDVFFLMESEFKKTYPVCYSDFTYIRKKSEEELRSNLYITNPNIEDFDIQNIYQNMNLLFQIPPDICLHMCNYEKYIEKELCSCRKSAKTLYDLCIYLGKKVFITSDMYLDLSTIKEILSKNGYTNITDILLSSDCGKIKYTGHIYDELINRSGEKPHSIVHIGDNWNLDFIKSQEHGLISIFYPKAIDSFNGLVGNVKTNNLSKTGTNIIKTISGPGYQLNSFTYRSMLSIVANTYFDNPYVSYNSGTDYNLDPTLVGLFPVGMHLVGISSYITDYCIKKKKNKVVFLSRDGYLPMLSFEIMKKSLNLDISAEYVYCSRRALMPFIVSCESDLFNLPIVNTAHSPKSLVNILKFCSKKMYDNKIRDVFAEKGIEYEVNFKNQSEYFRFVRVFINTIYSKHNHNKSKNAVKEYYRSRIDTESVIFDLGYSGKIPSALNRALGFSAEYIYVYESWNSSGTHHAKEHIEIDSIYPIEVNQSGLFREFLLSSQEGSCVGFEGGSPVLEDGNRDYVETFVLSTIQQSALEFVKIYYEFVKKWPQCNIVQPFLASLPFEDYIVNLSESDRKIYASSYSEDNVYGHVDKINMCEAWDRLIIRDEKTEKPISEHVSMEEALKGVLLDQNTLNAIIEKIFKNDNLKTRVTDWLLNDDSK